MRLLILALVIFLLACGKSAGSGQPPDGPETIPAIPAFSVNNPWNFDMAAEVGAKLAKKLPVDWMTMEPFMPQEELKPLKDYTFEDLGAGDLPAELQDRLRDTLEQIRERIDEIDPIHLQQNRREEGTDQGTRPGDPTRAKICVSDFRTLWLRAAFLCNTELPDL